APMNPNTSVVPSYMAPPSQKTPAQAAPAAQSPRTRLRDYVPQAAVEEPLPADATRLPDSVVAEYADFSEAVLTPAMYQQQQITRLTRQAEASQNQQPSAVKQLPLTLEPASQMAAQAASQPKPAQTAPIVDPITGELYGPYVPYKPTT